MKRFALSLVIVTFLGLGVSLAGAENQGRVETSRAAAMSLGKQLQQELQTAMKSGGPVAAVDVCHLKAPTISAQVSSTQAMEVGRTSLRLRNPNNAPDSWEKGVLEQFEARKSAGEKIAELEYSEVVEDEDGKAFRYMKAIPTAEVCLNCHGGAEVSQAVEAKVQALYPTDQARGFSVGDIRGAFTIRQDM